MAKEETAFLEPSLSDNASFEQWTELGIEGRPDPRPWRLEEGAGRIRGPAAGRGHRRGAARLCEPEKGFDARQLVLNPIFHR